MPTDPHLAVYAKGLEDAAQAHVDRVYVARADERQRSMGLAYVTAERTDLAREMVKFVRSIFAPGTRVVAQVQIGETCPMCGHVAEPLPDEAIAALRALTGGDDRG